MTVLVTGGAGYIGAHVVRQLQQDDRDVVVVDDLSTGDAARVAGVPLVRLDLADPGAVPRLAATLREAGVAAVVHLAARKQVGESVARPAWYYQQNVTGLANLITAMEQVAVDRLVFSSSAAVYGTPTGARVVETEPTAPVNPYGETKLAGEWLVRSAGRAWGLRGTSLRYFNVAGAGDPALADTAVANLVTMTFARLGAGRRPEVFGGDYPTPDGSCIRDFVHVADVASAHVVALDHLERAERRSDVFNVGTGTGASVLQVLAEIGRVTGLDTTPQVVGRRPGDPAQVVASVERIGAELGWRARSTLAETLQSAWLGRQATAAR